MNCSRHAICVVRSSLTERATVALPRILARIHDVPPRSSPECHSLLWVGTAAGLALVLKSGAPLHAETQPQTSELAPPKLKIRTLKDGDRLNIVLIGKTGAGKSSVANMLAGSKKFAASNDLSSVTNEVQYVDFEYRRQRFRIIDTPGFFDTKMSAEEIQQSLNQFSDVARDGIAAVLITTKKERFTAENESVCKFAQCVLGDDALVKYGMMLLTHTKQSPESLTRELERLPEGNHGRRMMDAVSKRVLPVETSGWWHSSRAPILGEVIRMFEGGGRTVVDCLMMEWSRIELQKNLEFEQQIAPLRQQYETELKSEASLRENAVEDLKESIRYMEQKHMQEIEQISNRRTVEWVGRVRHWTENVKDFGRGVRDLGVGLATGVTAVGVAAAGAATACSIM